MDPLRQELASKLQIIKDYRERIGLISQLHIPCESLAHFGCCIGEETFALFVLLDPREIRGLDKDKNAIAQARDWAVGVQTLINNLVNRIRVIPGYLQDLPESVQFQITNFVTKYQNRAIGPFIVGDMTKNTNLPANYFDLAYCERVLDNIACTDSKLASNNVLSAIREMARVVKPDGHVLALEHQTCRDGTSLNLAPLFEQVGLLAVEIPECIVLPKNRMVYLYRRSV